MTAVDSPATVRRKVNHSLFQYAHPVGGYPVIAFRGQMVDLLPADAERGESLDPPALVDPDAPTPSVGLLISKLPPFPTDGSEEEEREWVAAGTVEEVLAEVRVKPEIASLVLAAEESFGEGARRVLLEVLGQFVTDGTVE